jgi:LysM domain-containing protein
MAVATNLGVSPRAAGGQRVDVPRRSDRRPVPGVDHADGRRPARLVAARQRVVARPCGPRPVAGSIGWLVLAGVLTFLVVLGIGWSAGGNGGGPGGSVPAATQVVQVRQGDTLWSVAERLAPAAAPAAVVERIRQLNRFDVDSTVYPGELLRVPTALTGGAAAKAGVLQH